MAIATQAGFADIEEDIRQKLDDLRPVVQEAQMFESLLADLASVKQPKKSQKRATTRTATGRARRGSRTPEFLSLIRSRPGIRVSEAAKEMAIQPNYLYRIAASLIEAGSVEKRGKGFFLASPEAKSDAESDPGDDPVEIGEIEVEEAMVDDTAEAEESTRVDF